MKVAKKLMMVFGIAILFNYDLMGQPIWDTTGCFLVVNANGLDLPLNGSVLLNM
jgi:hypothetical protein